MAKLHGRRRGVLSGLRDLVCWLALIAALAGPLIFAAAGLGSRAGLWGWQFGLGTLAGQVAPVALFIGLGLGVAALVAAFAISPRGRGLVLALVALAISGGALYQAGQIRASAQAAPPLHDVTTDFEDPPAFSDGIAARRGAEASPIDINAPMPSFSPAYSGQTVRQAARAAYDDLETVTTDAAPEAAYDAALAAAEGMGWDIVLTDPAEGRIEAVATTFWFGFKDDIVIRVRPADAGGGAEIDVRSVSRVGLSDLGTNAARIRSYAAALEDELA